MSGGAASPWSPGFSGQCRLPPGQMTRHSEAAPMNTYLGRALSPEGTLPPRRPTGRPSSWVTAYVDDLLVLDGRNAWLLSTDDVLSAWASGHIALSELNSARPWGAARTWAGLPAILPVHNVSSTGVASGDATAEDTDGVSTCAAWGDPGDREELVLTYEQEFLYIVWWGIREREQRMIEEVD